MLQPIDRRGLPLAVGRPMGLASVFASALPEGGQPMMSPRKISVALLQLGDWQPWLAEASALLSVDEDARVRRRRFSSDRDTLVLAYALHRLLLGSAMGRDPADVPLHRDGLGCPRLPGDIAYTSLSHSQGFVALAVTASGPVGVDIEPRERAVAMAAIAGCVCHDSEAAELADLDEAARSAAMLALWVRKEALLKAAGIGLAVPMESFAAPEHHALQVPALFAEAVQVRMLDAGDDCVAAVAGASAVVVECGWLRPASPPPVDASARQSVLPSDHFRSALVGSG